MTEPRVSVVVPTRDRPSALAECLRALARQTLNGTLEVIVVDDGSHAPETVRAAVERELPEAQVVRGAGLGPAAARNIGARRARGSVVCFTDDDCRPDPGWSACLAAAVGEGADAVAGRTVLPPAAGSLTVASQLIADHFSGAGQAPFAAANNLACRAELLGALPFDPSYSLAGGEDRDWCARLVTSGRSLRLEQRATVVHAPPLDVRGFWRQSYNYGCGGQRFHRSHPEARWREPFSFYLGLLLAGLGRGPRVGMLVALAQLATATGRSVGAVGALRERARRR